MDQNFDNASNRKPLQELADTLNRAHGYSKWSVEEVAKKVEEHAIRLEAKKRMDDAERRARMRHYSCAGTPYPARRSARA